MSDEPLSTDQPVISVLVISYNTREMTLEALRSLSRETSVPHEVIVVDNASTDGSAEAIAAEFPHMRLIADGKNYGFALGNNIASVHARGKYILLLNPDTVVLDNAVDRLFAFAKRTPDALIWGGRTVFEDRSLNPGSVSGEITLWGLFCRATGLAIAFNSSTIFNPEDIGTWDRSQEREVKVVQGSFLLITRELWESLKGFDPIFVMYGDEQDLCRRAIALGARPRMTPEATIIHYHGGSSKRADREIMTLKAKATLVDRHFPKWQRPPAHFLLAMWPWSRMVSGNFLARLTGKSSLAEAATRWRTVWEARDNWRQGYTRPAFDTPTPDSAS